MNKRALTLYKRIENVGITDRFASPDIDRINTVTNVYELIEGEGVRRWLSLSGYAIEKMSDYERFSAYAAAVDLMSDSARREIFFEEIETLVGASDTSDISPAEIWKRGCAGISDICDEVEQYCNQSVAIRTTFPPFEDKMADFPTKRIFDLNFCVEELERSGTELSFEEWQESLVKVIGRSEDFSVYFDLKNTEFCRGDHYHAGKVYKKITEKQGIEKCERELLLFWILTFVCAKSGDKATLFLDLGENCKGGSELVSYLVMRDILPRTHIAVTRESVAKIKALCDICLMSKKITLDIVLGIEDSPSDIKDILEAALSHYPVVNLRFGGIKDDSLLTSASHRYCKKAIATALSELVTDDERAERIIDTIFKSKE